MQKIFKPLVFITLFVVGFGNAFAQPDNETAQQAYADLFFKRYEKAIANFSVAIGELPDNEQLIMLRGEAYYCNGNFEKAINDFAAAEKLSENIANLWLAKSFAQINNNQKAIEFLKKHLLGKNKKTKAEIRLDPAFKNLKESNEWIEFWRAGEYYSEIELKFAEAQYAYKQQDNAATIDLLDEIIKKRNSNYSAHFLRAKILAENNETKDAIKSVGEAIRFNNKESNYYRFRAKLWLVRKKYTEALSDIDEAIKLTGWNTEIYYEKAQILLAQGEKDTAIVQMEIYLKYYNQMPEVSYKCGLIYYETALYLKALACFTQALQSDLPCESYFIARGDTYAKTKTYRYAINDYSMALDINPYNGETYFKRGNARNENGDSEGAKSDWQKAVNYGYSAALLKL